MNTKSTTFIVLMGLLTTITLAGSIWLSLYLAGGNSINQSRIFPADNYALPAITMVISYLCGGGLWGWGIARMTNSDAKTMIKACALSWSIPTFIVVISLGIRLTTITSFGYTLPFRYTYYYLLFFIPLIGIVTGINARVVSGKLGLQESKNKIGRNVGFAAALGFLIVTLILLVGFGWEVGRPQTGEYAMLTILHWSSVGAALVGGSVLGRELAKLIE
ncbi:MAG TPA: hypothetical protein VJ972_05810 [Anaerolineales bacterium]|nr:hypothetical protein [Anaerolineales bacterium]